MREFVKVFLLCLYLSSMFFIIAVLFRSAPIGVDGFAFAINDLPSNINPILKGFFSLIPTFFIVRYFVLFLLLTVFLFGCYLLAKLFSKKLAWLAPIIVLSTPLTFIKFAELENEQFGYVFIPFIWLFFALFIFEKNKEPVNYPRFASCFFALLLLIFGSSFFWKGNLLFFVGFLFSSILFFFSGLILIVASYLVVSNDFWLSVIPNQRVGESVSWIAVAQLWLLNFGLFFLPKQFKVPVIVLFLFVLLNSVFAILLIPILAVGVLLMIEWFDMRIQTANWFVSFKSFFNFKQTIFIIAIIGLLVTFLMIPTLQPTKNQINAVKFAIDKSKGEKFNADWDYVHWIRYYGGKADGDGGCCPKLIKKGLVLTRWKLNCKLLKDFNDTKAYYCK